MSAAIRTRLAQNRTQCNLLDTPEDTINALALALGGNYTEESFKMALQSIHRGTPISGGLAKLVAALPIRSHVLEIFRLPSMRFKLDAILTQLGHSGMRVGFYLPQSIIIE
jgi:hypothetical protein